MSEPAAGAGGSPAGGRAAVRPTRSMGYTPLVPTFSPYTADAQAAVRLAWRATAAAFIAFVALAVGGPAAQNWYVRSAIEPRSAHMASINGAVYVQRRGSVDWLVAKPDEQIAPGDVVRTAASARAFIRLFDQSTVLLYPNSSFRMLRAEQGRFRTDRTALVVQLSQGRARIGVAPPRDPGAAFFQVRMPNAEVHLQEGSYSLDVERDVSQASTRLGQATAYTPGGVVNATAGQRLFVRTGRPPWGNQPARQDLLVNGWFTEKDGALPAGWIAGDRSEQDPPGTISLTALPGAVSLTRYGRGHGETFITQALDADLWDFDKVTLSANVRVLQHSLSGGGWQGSEYPLMLRVVYRDATGGVLKWYRGYYLDNRDDFSVRDGEQLPSSDWQHVEIDLLALAPRPWRIQSVDVVASGWDYVSAISEVHVWAE